VEKTGASPRREEAFEERTHHKEEEAMQYVLLIYQATTPVPAQQQAWATVSEDEKKAIYAEYAAINQTPGVTPGLPLGLPEKATTVRVQNGKTVAQKGPFVDVGGAIGGYYVFDAKDLDEAIKMASRIPAARLGGAIEVRPVEKYW